MTDRMREEQLDREIRGFLAWQAEDIADAPSATEIATYIGSRVRTRTLVPSLAPQLVWVVLAGLLIAALAGAALVGSSLLQSDPHPLGRSYEAVFLRIEVAEGSLRRGYTDRPSEVVVVGVNAEGREREIARLPGAWVAYGVGTGPGEVGYLAPMGAVSPSGLLAMPGNRGEANLSLQSPMMHWEIFDLRRPQADPIIVAGIRQDIEQFPLTPQRVDVGGGAFWGVESGCRTRDASGAEITTSGGGIVRRNADGTGEELLSSSGVEYACLAPDDSTIVHEIEIGEGRGPATAARPIAGLLAPGSGAWLEIEGNFAGWLEVES